MARRNQHTKDEIQQLSLQAVEALLYEHNHEAISTRMVAKAIGYTVGTLYTVFKHQADMLLHVNARTMDRMFLHCQRGISDSNTAEHNLTLMALSYHQFALQEPNHWNLVFSLRLPENEPLPQWQQANIDRIFHLLEYELARLSPETSPQSIQKNARILWSGVHGMTTLSLNNKLFIEGITDVETLLTNLVHQLVLTWSGA
ncbi:TetR/AcrR family transcriptional regulator [Zooshikella marina]|uniref:TetR/AcrR family transcriptional regulator n=1 Tax=Zooshikella ganghwensis TaxID=202772 RepID=A0A4P9VHQ0_9GAMM|nr:TetR/AcrR family transcriptional regulator [Zooshikella ganghwensis]MBU2707469.1 TetR/AcrR family transcriptional regulator [Zooshikella ganghwensis]RDH42708.1 TetR/AcrR family transcriptional regulator [Zooshikella ganghwensis]